MHPAITVGLTTPLLMRPELFCQHSIFFRRSLSLHIAVVTASGHAKELAHDRDRILFLVTVDNLVLKFRSHILSVSERKSRSNSTSIFSRLFSYLYSCNVLAGLRPLLFGTPCSSFFRSRFSRSCTGRSQFNPSVFSTSDCVIPAANISLICGSNFCIC